MCIGPLILTSLSILTIPLFPGLVVTVILEGLPNEYSPVLSTDNPLITPTLLPLVSISVNPFSSDSSILFSILFNLFFLSNIAFWTSNLSTYSASLIWAHTSPSTIISIILLNWVESLYLSPQILVLNFITSSTAS